jgi:hypothetical protein
MKKFAALVLILLPCIAFGQLFPKIPDFKGNIRQVTEKRYGRELNLFGLLKNKYYPGIYSGWKYTYHFNNNSKLIRQTNIFKGKISTEFIYQFDTIDNRTIERRITSEKSSQNQGNYIEYENFINQGGRVEKVNFKSFDSRECTSEIFLVEQNAEYAQDRLISFTRQNIDANGESASAEKCSLIYNSSGQIIRIERKDVETGLTTILYYFYNEKGLVDHYSVDYLAGLVEYGMKDQNQDIYFDYDRYGNWTRMYLRSDKKKRVQAKRRIKYF